jgi:hypothetical protein
MAMHVVGYELSSSLSSLTVLTPIPDGTVAIASNDIKVPTGLANLAWIAAMINSAAATLRIQAQSPSLRATLNLDVTPIANGLVFGNPPEVQNYLEAPIPLQATEGLNVLAQNGAAVMNRAFVCFADGPAQPTSGRIYTVRFTTSITLATASWVNGAMTLGQTLPVGNYQVVGLRVWSANSCCARLFFVGGQWRPGVPTGTTSAAKEWNYFRFGNAGVWGQFNNITPPSLDVMGITDTAQEGVLDLIKVS